MTIPKNNNRLPPNLPTGVAAAVAGSQPNATFDTPAAALPVEVFDIRSPAAPPLNAQPGAGVQAQAQDGGFRLPPGAQPPQAPAVPTPMYVNAALFQVIERALMHANYPGPALSMAWTAMQHDLVALGYLSPQMVADEPTREAMAAVEAFGNGAPYTGNDPQKRQAYERLSAFKQAVVNQLTRGRGEQAQAFDAARSRSASPETSAPGGPAPAPAASAAGAAAERATSARRGPRNMGSARYEAPTRAGAPPATPPGSEAQVPTTPGPAGGGRSADVQRGLDQIYTPPGASGGGQGGGSGSAPTLMGMGADAHPALLVGAGAGAALAGWYTTRSLYRFGRDVRANGLVDTLGDRAGALTTRTAVYGGRAARTVVGGGAAAAGRGARGFARGAGRAWERTRPPTSSPGGGGGTPAAPTASPPELPSPDGGGGSSAGTGTPSANSGRPAGGSGTPPASSGSPPPGGAGTPPAANGGTPSGGSGNSAGSAGSSARRAQSSTTRPVASHASTVSSRPGTTLVNLPKTTPGTVDLDLIRQTAERVGANTWNQGSAAQRAAWVEETRSASSLSGRAMSAAKSWGSWAYGKLPSWQSVQATASSGVEAVGAAATEVAEHPEFQAAKRHVGKALKGGQRLVASGTSAAVGAGTAVAEVTRASLRASAFAVVGIAWDAHTYSDPELVKQHADRIEALPPHLQESALMQLRIINSTQSWSGTMNLLGLIGDFVGGGANILEMEVRRELGRRLEAGIQA